MPEISLNIPDAAENSTRTGADIVTYKKLSLEKRKRLLNGEVIQKSKEGMINK